MATPYDAVGKDLVEVDPTACLTFRGRPRPGELVRLIDADLSATISTATHKIVRVDDPEPWLVLIELQANWDGDLPLDLLRPSANPAARTGAVAQPDPLGGGWDFPFRVIRVWEHDADEFLKGPLSLVP